MGPRVVLMAGVASACLLGAAAGAWVRPDTSDLKAREVVRTPQRAMTPAHPPLQVQIVMQDEALPARPPMEVLPDWAANPAPILPPPPEPPARLVKVEAKAEPRAGKPEAEKVKMARAEKPKAAKPERPKSTKPDARPKEGKAKVIPAQVETKPKPPTKIVKPKAEPPKPKPPILAKAEPGPPSAPVRVATAPPKAILNTKVANAEPPPNPWADEDRRLARAYRRAAEAGVPEWRLARQQVRWRQARDAAAREAPWAVPDVYDARIAELDDLAGEAAMEWD